MIVMREDGTIQERLYLIAVFIMVVFTCFLCFYHLGTASVWDWDEARHGVSAYEMLQTDELVLTTYGYETDYWNLKPPLSEYFIVLGYRIFGYNAYGLRFYAAAAMLVNTVLCAFYTYKRLGKCASLFVFIAMDGCIPLWCFHCARSGDADSLFILFCTLAVIGLCEAKRSVCYLYLSCISFSFAFLTKSWHAGVIAIDIFLYFLIAQYWKNMKLRNYIVCGLCTIIPIAVWAVFRASSDGITFFQNMINIDLLNRSLTVLENHGGDAWYYIRYYFSFENSVTLLALALVPYICNTVSRIRNKRDHALTDVTGKQILLPCTLAVIVPFFIFGMASTKLTWYILCIYPSLILLASIGVHKICIFTLKDRKYCVLLAIVLIVFIEDAVVNAYDIINTSSSGSIGDYLMEVVERKAEYSGAQIYLEGQGILGSNVSDWTQSALLAAEWAGDFFPVNGGIDAWQKTNDAYLFIHRDFLEWPQFSKISYKIVAENEQYMLLQILQ